MNNAEQEYTQPLGLDIGTSRIVVARNGEKKCQYDAQLNAFLTIPYSKLAESLLQREEVFHEVQGADIVVAGDEARKFAEIFHLETRRPMANGVLNPHEPHSLAVIRRIIGKLLGPAAAEGQKVFFSVPAPIGESGRRHRLSRGVDAPDSDRPGLRADAHTGRAGRGLRGTGGIQLHRHRSLLRQRTLQCLPRRVIGSGAQFQRAESRGLHRLPGRRGHRRPRHAPARAEGTERSG